MTEQVVEDRQQSRQQSCAAVGVPMAMLAELTHRCPLQCPYCSNPLELESRSAELDTLTWKRVFSEAAELGVLQVHISGGEPTARKDLVELIAHCRAVGLYTNLITSAVLLDAPAVAKLYDAGLDHVQISVQDADAANADRIAGFPGHAKKMEAARLVRLAGLPLTLNAVVHRQNVDSVPDIIDLALHLDAHRLEIACVQYYGWAWRNRAALIPTRAQTERIVDTVKAARTRLQGRLVIDYVVPDYYARYPKACMGGWGRLSLNVTPSGNVLPCHAAETITGITFDTVRDTSLADIWQHSQAFRMFRGTGWMPEPCHSCDRREVDWGGCRCQAFALLGDAGQTDPACIKSPHHTAMRELAEAESEAPPPAFAYRSKASGR